MTLAVRVCCGHLGRRGSPVETAQWWQWNLWGEQNGGRMWFLCCLRESFEPSTKGSFTPEGIIRFFGYEGEGRWTQPLFCLHPVLLVVCLWGGICCRTALLGRSFCLWMTDDGCPVCWLVVGWLRWQMLQWFFWQYSVVLTVQTGNPSFSICTCSMFVLVGTGSDGRLLKPCLCGAANSAILRSSSSHPCNTAQLTLEERRRGLLSSRLLLFHPLSDASLSVLDGTRFKSSHGTAQSP